MASLQRWFRRSSFRALALKDDFVTDDRGAARRPKSMRSDISWRRCSLGMLVCLIFCAPITISAQSEPKAAGDTVPEDGSGLPPGYEPPKEPPAEMLLEKRILSPEDQKRIAKELNRNYLKRIRSGDLRSDAARKEILEGIKFRLNALTIADNRKNYGDLRNRITGNGGDIQQAGRLMEKENQVLDFRTKFLQMFVDEAAQLFDNNYYVRLQAALLLGELNLVEEDSQKQRKREAFPPAAKPLCRVLEDPNQPDGVKNVATLSLIRILTSGNPNVEQKREIATALLGELKRADANPWYQRRLTEALGRVDVARDLDNQPFVFNALNQVLNDPSRDLRTRTMAAWSLGRIPLDRSLDLNKLVVDIAALAQDIAEIQAKQPKHPDLRRCAFLLYLAFHAKDDDDKVAKRDANQAGGLLNEPAIAGPAKEAYQQVLPIVREIIAGKTVPPERVQDLNKWLQARGYKPQSVENASAKRD